MHNGLKSASDGNGDAVSIEDSTVITSRLQKLDVKTAGFKLPDVIEWSALQEEAMEMPKAVPSFITALFTGKEDVEGVPNKFASMVPSAIIFDVSCQTLPCTMTHRTEELNCVFFPAIPELYSGSYPCDFKDYPSARCPSHRFLPSQCCGDLPVSEDLIGCKKITDPMLKNVFSHFALAEHGGKFDVMRVRVEESVARGEDLDEATQKASQYY